MLFVSRGNNPAISTVCRRAGSFAEEPRVSCALIKYTDSHQKTVGWFYTDEYQMFVPKVLTVSEGRRVLKVQQRFRLCLGFQRYATPSPRPYPDRLFISATLGRIFMQKHTDLILLTSHTKLRGELEDEEEMLDHTTKAAARPVPRICRRLGSTGGSSDGWFEARTTPTLRTARFCLTDREPSCQVKGAPPVTRVAILFRIYTY